MTFPSVLSITQSSFTSSTTHNVSMPAVVAKDNLLLVIMVFSGFNLSDPGPSGWTKVNDTSQIANLRTGVYSRRADGTEGGTTYNFSTGAACSAAAQCWRISNGGVVVSVDATSFPTPSANPNPPSNGSGSTTDNLWIAGMAVDNDSAGTITSYPTNYSSNQTETNSVPASATDPTLGCASRNLATSTEDPGTFTVASGQWAAFTIVVRSGISTPPFQPNTPRVWRVQ